MSEFGWRDYWDTDAQLRRVDGHRCPRKAEVLEELGGLGQPVMSVKVV